jgi:hypothetical protein
MKIEQAAEIVATLSGITNRPAELLIHRPTREQFYAMKQRCLTAIEEAFALLKDRYDKIARDEAEEVSLPPPLPL